MRGIYFYTNENQKTIRFNPAYAGNIIAVNINAKKIQVQPRVCGEYSPIPVAIAPAAGSTPRMRGICHDKKFAREYYRFNPAYAGNIL